MIAFEDYQEKIEQEKFEEAKDNKPEEIILPKRDVLSLDRVKTRCKSEATKGEYVRINRDFNSWFHKKYHNKDTVEQQHIEEYLQTYFEQGKNTRIVVSALKKQFEQVLHKSFDWHGLARDSENKHEHKAWSMDTINKWISDAHTHPEY